MRERERYSVSVFEDKSSLTRAAAEYVVFLATQAIAARGRFSWALAGGTTPRALYELLASEAFAPKVDWARVHFFWGDERCVPPDHTDSNYHMVKAALLDAIGVRADQVHRMRGEGDPQEEAARYERLLRSPIQGSESSGPPPFDLVLLGMGADGHTASLFPGTRALVDDGRWVRETYVESLAAWRLTLTPRIINAAAHIAFLVAGADKSVRLAEVLRGAPDDAGALPAQRIHATTGDTRWLVDRGAAAALEPGH